MRAGCLRCVPARARSAGTWKAWALTSTKLSRTVRRSPTTWLTTLGNVAQETNLARGVEFVPESLVVNLEDGRTLSVPLEWSPRLRDATPSSAPTGAGSDPEVAFTGPSSTKTSLSLVCSGYRTDTPRPIGVASTRRARA